MTRRMLDSRVWTNNRFGQLPIMARLLLLGIINLADDQGRLMAHPVYLRSQIFPYDDVAIDDIHKWRQLFVKNGTIAIYEADNKEYIQLLNWWEYQSLQFPAPSEYPALPDWQDRIRYNAKGGVILTYNWINVKGEPLPDTCDSHGNPLGRSSRTPPANPHGNPSGTPYEASSGNPSERPLEAPIRITIQDQLQDQEQQEDDEDDTPARDPVHAAWFETYQDEMPPKIEKAMPPLVTECGESAVIHGIRESIRADSRSFKFIAECARNYIPPPPIPANGYQAEPEVEFMPTVHPIQYQPYRPLSPPLPTDDPWAIALAELSLALPGVAASWLKGSRLQENGELAGVPFYRVIVATDAANIGWLKQQAEPTIRKKISSLIGKRVEVEIVAA